ncbi:MAG: tRNA 5-methoxyuridine(34)/uridine 5-oxyacetic acid(34) synthase CmoB [Pseudomonadota bacterium]
MSHPFDLTLLRQLVTRSPLETLLPLIDADPFAGLNHGDLPRWRTMLENLPSPLGDTSTSPGDVVQIGSAGELGMEDQAVLEAALRELIPWRKGPFSVFGTHIDTEWRSELKWHRLLPHISPLAGRRVLDVGCGNGYHCFRALEERASLVLGIDPHLPYVMQFWLLRHFVPDWPLFVLPLTLEGLPAPKPAFDTVFSMGVLYHRRSPFDHLMDLRRWLRPGGELVLETLVVEGERGYALTPDRKYCRMGNVWFVPSCATTEQWLRRCGYHSIRTVDVSPTTTDEQRATKWMPFQSLADGLDPNNPDLTIEGLPAPRRAIIIARAP